MLLRHATGLVTFDVPDDSAAALAVTKRDLCAQHQAHHVAYPQYAEWCDDAVLLQVERTTRYKGGAVLTAGTYVLAVWDKGWPEAELEPHWTAWDATTGWHVALAESKASVVA